MKVNEIAEVKYVYNKILSKKSQIRSKNNINQNDVDEEN